MKGPLVVEPESPQRSVEKIFASLKDLLSDINEDWEGEEVAPTTRLVDLGLESISLVYLVAELQQMYSLGDRLFRKMREDGTLLKDMTVGNIVDLLGGLVDADGSR